MLAAALLLASHALASRADVAVIANRTASRVTFAVQRASPNAKTPTEKLYTLRRFDVLPLPLLSEETTTVRFRHQGVVQAVPLTAWQLYEFRTRSTSLALVRAPLPDTAQSAELAGLAPALVLAQDAPVTSANVVHIPVKVLVDDDEVTQRHVWEPRLRERLAEASRVVQRHCGVTFDVVAVDTWQTDDRQQDFERCLWDFASHVDPAPGRLAIGFSTQFAGQLGPTKLGGIPQPFFSHILVRDWPQRQSAGERLEVLVHELGHYLGAAHSPDLDSSMRPVVGDQQANSRAFRIGYDGLNTLALNLVADALRRSPETRSLATLPADTKARLLSVYLAQAIRLADDPAALRFIELMGVSTRPLLPTLELLRLAPARPDVPD